MVGLLGLALKDGFYGLILYPIPRISSNGLKLIMFALWGLSHSKAEPPLASSQDQVHTIFAQLG